ncbi:hypothetical protein B0H12DRAFT_280767 [Mycena haematopus]|nr:hypothetical protein B0H12DRAFT_280767 [Mycena haematopus]
MGVDAARGRCVELRPRRCDFVLAGWSGLVLSRVAVREAGVDVDVPRADAAQDGGRWSMVDEGYCVGRGWAVKVPRENDGSSGKQRKGGARWGRGRSKREAERRGGLLGCCEYGRAGAESLSVLSTDSSTSTTSAREGDDAGAGRGKPMRIRSRRCGSGMWWYSPSHTRRHAA